MNATRQESEDKLSRQKVAIVGVGGTGSHILDFISRMAVAEIHLFDGDNLSVENTKRSPGVVPQDRNKARFYAEQYASLHPNVLGCDHYIDDTNAASLANYTTVFLSIDCSRFKRKIIEVCSANDVVLIHVGMGVHRMQNNLLRGLATVTMILPDFTDHVEKCISLDNRAKLDNNHQTIELNALNAALAVIRWKKHLGIYADESKSLDICYSIENSIIVNRFDQP